MHANRVYILAFHNITFLAFHNITLLASLENNTSMRPKLIRGKKQIPPGGDTHYLSLIINIRVHKAQYRTMHKP